MSEINVASYSLGLLPIYGWCWTWLKIWISQVSIQIKHINNVFVHFKLSSFKSNVKICIVKTFKGSNQLKNRRQVWQQNEPKNVLVSVTTSSLLYSPFGSLSSTFLISHHKSMELLITFILWCHNSHVSCAAGMKTKVWPFTFCISFHISSYWKRWPNADIVQR